MMTDAIETAIKMETDALVFYDEASGNCSHPFAIEMFKGFMKDETRHLKMLREIFANQPVTPDFASPRATVNTVFSLLKDAMMERVKVLGNELEAVNIALKFEKEGFDFYKKAAVEAGSEEEGKLFERLAAEEDEHYSILLETYEFLDNTGHWYMYEERGIVEG